MRRILTWLRRAIAVIALSVLITTLVWLVRTQERGDLCRVHYDRRIEFGEAAFSRTISFDIGSRGGRIGIDFADWETYEQEPFGWWTAHTRTDTASASYTIPGPLDEQLSEEMELIVDGLWRPLHDRGIGVRLYVAAHDAFSGPVIRSNAFILRLALPHWLIASVAGLVLILTVRPDWRRHRRSARGHCPHCGYDLRASPDRCPECGKQPGPKRR